MNNGLTHSMRICGHYLLCSMVVTVWVGVRPAMCAQASTETIAVLPEGSPEADAIVDLMQVELSKGGLSLVDRGELTKTLKEQGLGSESFDSADAITLGHLLKCDVFATFFYHKDEGAAVGNCSVIAFDSATGARLCDVAVYSEGALDAVSKAASDALVASLAKRKLANNRAVSILSLRVIDCPQAVAMGNSLQMLLERKLLAYPSISILERTRLDQVNRETMVQAHSQKNLQKSSVLVSADIVNSGGSNATCHVTLTTGSGDPLGSLSISNMIPNIEVLASKIAEGVAGQLKSGVASPSGVSARREADFFCAEQAYYRQRGMTNEACIARQAALAIGECGLAETPGDQSLREFVGSLLGEEFINQVNQHGDTDWIITLAGRYVDVTALRNVESRWNLDVAVPPVLARVIKDVRQNGTDDQKSRIESARRQFAGFMIPVLDREIANTVPTLEPGTTNIVMQSLMRSTYDVYGRMMVELCGNGADGLLDLIEKYGLVYSGYADIAVWTGTPAPCRFSGYPSLSVDYWDNQLFDPMTFTPAQKRRLLGLYEAQVTNDASTFLQIDCHCCAILMVNDSPEAFEKPDEIVARHIKALCNVESLPACDEIDAKLTASDTTFAPHHQPLRDAYQQMLTEEFRDVIKKYDAAHVACWELLVMMDERDQKGAPHPGWYLEKAAKDLQDTSLKQAHTPSNYSKEEWQRYLLKRTSDFYKSRYGKTLPLPVEATVATGTFGVSRLLAGAAGDNLVGVRQVDGQVYALFQSGGQPAWATQRLRSSDTRTSHSKDGHGLSLRVMDIKAGTGKELGRLDADVAFEGESPLSVDVSEHGIHVPTSKGVVTFQREGGAVTRVGPEQGLPTEGATSVVEVNGKLFVGLRGQEGFLVSCGRDGAGLDVVTCSGRKDVRSQLDNCVPYTINHMLWDVANERLFFSVTVPFDVQEGRNVVGTYVYSPAAGSITNLAIDPCWSSYTLVRWFRPQVDGQYLVCVNPGGLGFSKPGQPPEFCSCREDSTYAIWEPSSFNGRSYAHMVDFIMPIIGDGARRQPYSWDVPVFPTMSPKEGDEEVYPAKGSGLAILDETRVVVVNDDTWYVVPREDSKEKLRELPKLDGDIPIWVDAVDGDILAATQKGIWRVNIR